MKAIQGSDPHLFFVSLMCKLTELKKELSYSQLARDLNFDALAFLLWAKDDIQSKQEQMMGLICFVNLLYALGFKNRVLQQLEEDGQESVEQGEAPWDLSTGPVTRNRIVHAFEQFENAVESKKIVLGPSDNVRYIEMIGEMAFKREYWFKAKKLLEKSYPKDFEKYAERFETRASELIQQAVRKSGLIPE